MAHKAYAFDWRAFDSDLAPVLLAALGAEDCRELAEFIDRELGQITDPYSGDSLPIDWRCFLEVGDLQELADYALTRYYRVRDDHGIGAAWLRLRETLSEEQSRAILGAPFGMSDRLFDPGRLGSYFQSPDVVAQSSKVLAGLTAEEVQPFKKLLAECAARRLGVYVTF